MSGLHFVRMRVRNQCEDEESSGRREDKHYASRIVRIDRDFLQ